MTGVLRPCTDDALKKALSEVLEEVDNALSTLTMKTTLKQAEVKLSLKEGTMSDRKSEHKEWADGVLYQLLAGILEENPELLNENQSQPAVRKPLSAYFMWLADNRASIVNSLGNAKAHEITRKAGELWAGLSTEVKEDYKKKAKTAKEEYEKLNKKGTGRQGAPAKPSAKATPSQAQKKTKRGISGWTLFVKDKRSVVATENPSLSFGELSTKMAELWKGLSTKEREIYDERALAAKNADKDDDDKEAPPAKRQRKPSAKKSTSVPEDGEEPQPSKQVPKKAVKNSEKEAKGVKPKEKEPCDKTEEEKKTKRKPAPKKVQRENKE